MEFIWGVWTEPREAKTAESAELLIVWECVEKFLKRGDIGEDGCGKAVDQKDSCGESKRPVCKGHLCG